MPTVDKLSATRPSWRHWVQDRFAAALLTMLRPLPYDRRIRTIGWLGANLIGPIAGMRARIRTNLEYVMPGLPESEVAHLCRQVPGNMARTMAEIFTGAEFLERARASTIEGTGMPILQAAHRDGRPVLLVTAHLGNYDAARGYLLAQGFNVAGFYMPMTNPAFNTRYVAAISRIGTPVFARGREGLTHMLRFLRRGGMVGMVVDHYMEHGELVDFMGKPARTALSAAELALKYNALLVPVYGIRNPDGVSFRVRIEDPVPHSDPQTMTAALNQSLEALVRTHMDQWMWSHRRWKNT
ncbi:lysophospholipid acyltransferase family protein [Roseinatronobacter alkalisoli]|uniref:Lysophospholipid acyltransferase family protein n=1 Tax=Roseinatronobacter alkalisoli TaxID=3028235 RepID=A0ABT5TAI9_9RHOB|nr:lysophospholipid acyltransferase family protein [Roseinatronobacter sp. HJB301]MDD7972131.1 lysophospholipid acyltransferase family protein [Roseinatronobacter sp. HJB301]